MTFQDYVLLSLRLPIVQLKFGQRLPDWVS